MRFKLSFELENEHFPIQYRKNILSFIKYSLSEYNKEYYEMLYSEGENTIKPYTSAVSFRQPKFEEDEIIIESKMFEMNMSVEDYNIAVILYNSFNKQKNKKFSLNNNSWTLKNISMSLEKEITNEEVSIKFLSPLVVRSRENRKDYYYSFNHENFLETLKVNIKEQLKISNISLDSVDTFEIQPIQAKKTVIKFYEKQIECSLGTFNIKGDVELLKYLYSSGIGSKHSSGFGMFEVI